MQPGLTSRKICQHTKAINIIMIGVPLSGLRPTGLRSRSLNFWEIRKHTKAIDLTIIDFSTNLIKKAEGLVFGKIRQHATAIKKFECARLRMDFSYYQSVNGTIIYELKSETNELFCHSSETMRRRRGCESWSLQKMRNF